MVIYICMDVQWNGNGFVFGAYVFDWQMRMKGQSFKNKASFPPPKKRRLSDTRVLWNYKWDWCVRIAVNHKFIVFASTSTSIFLSFFHHQLFPLHFRCAVSFDIIIQLKAINSIHLKCVHYHGCCTCLRVRFLSFSGM